MKKILLGIFLILGMISCKNNPKDKVQEALVEKPKVKLHVLDGGTVQVNMLEIFSEEMQLYKGESKTFCDAFYVIEHPNGIMVWDAGLPESLAGLPEPYTTPDGAFTVSRKDSLKNQLEAINVNINDIKYLGLSHTHFDHIGTANAFAHATWLVQENEYNFVHSDSQKVQQPDIYNAIKELKNVKKLHGDLDVFGDGTVVIKYMPGHTIGHQVLYLDLGLEKPILLTGDMYHFEENRENKVAPMFNYDIPQTKASMEQFENFAKEQNAMVFIQHSPKDFERLKEVLKKN